MNSIDERLKDISEIRSLMEQSSKFLSLSGLSGISAGIVGIAAAVVAYWRLTIVTIPSTIVHGSDGNGDLVFFFVEAVITLTLALSLAAFFSVKMTKKKGLPVWTSTTKSLLFNLFIPLAAGGTFCLMLLFHNLPLFIGPAMLIFYGLALMNSGKYTLNEVRYLGLCELCLGLAASWWIQFGLIFWGIGFGLLHIVYGTFMYVKYEK